MACYHWRASHRAVPVGALREPPQFRAVHETPLQQCPLIQTFYCIAERKPIAAPLTGITRPCIKYSMNARRDSAPVAQLDRATDF